VIILVSPYHMTTREPVAMASLALAEYVVTALPTPAGAPTREAVTRAAERVTQYADLMHLWEWAMPLFDAGLCGTSMSGEDPLDELLTVSRAIDEDDRYAGLRPFMRTVLAEAGDDMLRALCRDVIRTGPDPAISVPVTAGLDRFAHRHDLIAARSHDRSKAQRYESQLATPVMRFALPVILQGPADRILEYRGRMLEELELLLQAIEAEDEQGARVAADAVAIGVEREHIELTRVDDPDDPRVVIGLVSVTLAEQPVDAVLTASSLAATSVLGHEQPEIRTAESQSLRVIQIAPIGGRAPRR